jgi:ABC-type bacteriocin/lantibiotic exporter with double-glycine peptidase domain
MQTSGIIMKPVVQLEPTGCGIASVAAIVGLSYAQTKAVASSLGISAQDERLWSETAHVRKLLEHLGVKTGRAERPFRSWEALPDLALLSIKWHVEKGRPFWHWVVFMRDHRGARVFDPKASLRRHVRTDFGRMKPKWFIPIIGAQQHVAGNASIAAHP